MLVQGSEKTRFGVIVKNLETELKRQSITPYALSKRINPGSKNMVSRLLSGKPVELTAFLAVEEELGLSYGELLKDSPSATVEEINKLLDAAAENRALYTLKRGPSVEEFLRWYHQSGGEITPDNRLLEYVDIYDTPTDDGFFVNPIHIGSSSLAARKLRETNPKRAVELLSAENLDFCRKTSQDHRSVFSGNSILDERIVDEKLSDGTIVTARFTRSLRLGRFSGAPVVLNFASEI